MYRMRFLRVIIGCFFTRPIGMLGDYDLHFVAWPVFDADVTRVFTHAYSAWLGLGRWHYVFASPFKGAAVRNKWVPVTTAEKIIYKRSVKIFERVTLRTKLLCWDEKRFFLQQTFLVGSEVRVTTLVEGLVRSPKGHLNPIDVFKTMGLSTPSPAFPEEIRKIFY